MRRALIWIWAADATNPKLKEGKGMESPGNKGLFFEKLTPWFGFVEKTFSLKTQLQKRNLSRLQFLKKSRHIKIKAR